MTNQNMQQQLCSSVYLSWFIKLKVLIINKTYFLKVIVICIQEVISILIKLQIYMYYFLILTNLRSIVMLTIISKV